MRSWFEKLFLVCFARLYHLIAVKPFLRRVDPNTRCPACGNRKGRIKAVVLEKPDSQQSVIAILHTCELDGFQWLEPSAQIITDEDHAMPVPRSADEEQEAIKELTASKHTKSVRTGVKVNGELVS